MYSLVTTSAIEAVSIPVTVTEPAGSARLNEGIHSGIPFEKGAVRSTDDLILTDSGGSPVAVQFEPLSLWEDGSMRWVQLNFTETLQAGETRNYTLRTRKRH